MSFFFSRNFPCTVNVFKHLAGNNVLEGLSRPLNTKIYISPRQHVVIAPNRYRGTSYRYGTDFTTKDVTKLFNWISFIPFVKERLQIDRKDYQNARLISEGNVMNQCEDNEKDFLKYRILKLENDLGILIEMIKQNEENSKNQFEMIKNNLVENMKVYTENALFKSQSETD